MNYPEPPGWAQRFLKWYCNPKYLEEIQGDIYELFDRRVEKQGHKKAKLKFVWDVLRFFRISNIKSNSNYSIMNRTLLFRNYLKLGMRSIRKNMVSSFINIFGLALAISFAVNTFIFIDLQLNMDVFFTKKDRIYQVANFMQEEGTNRRWSDSPLLLGPQIKADHPSVESFARIEYSSASVRRGDDVFDERISFVDPAFLEILDFDILGGRRKALYNKNQMVISKDMAIKYFSDEDPIGKELSLKFTSGKIIRLTVGAVLDDFPYNASIKEHLMVPIDQFFDLKFADHYDWSYLTDATFILLKEGESIQSVASSFPSYIELQHGSNPEWKIDHFDPMPLRALALNAFEMVGAIADGGHPAGRMALIVISLFLLGMACFNFMNISVVGATKRLKEIALRKVMGGVRRQIINQFLVENILQCFFALIIGTLITYFFLVPLFDHMIPPIDFQFRTSSPWNLVIFFFTLLLGVGLVSGAYPAFYISKFDSVTIFKGSQKFGSKNLFSRIMLGFQFFLAFLTIVGCFVFTDQSWNLTDRDWGYDPAGTISVWVPNRSEYEKLRNEVVKYPNIESYSASSAQIGRYIPMRSMEYEGRNIRVTSLGVSSDYLETMQLRLIDGRFLTDQASDVENSVVVNETFLRQLGWMEDPINKTFVFDSVRRTVVGVVADFHYYDFYSSVDPVIFSGLNEDQTRYLSIRTTPENLFEMETFTHEAWLKIAPNDPFDRTFQEDVFDNFYQENRTNMALMIMISIFAIILACLGLYGLLSYNIQGKMKEFSVRKVLGATPKTLAKIASKQYSWIVLISFVLGAPLGFVVILQLINTIYPDPTPVTAWPFVVSIVMIILTMTITVIGQIKKAIEVNPSDILRNE